MASYFTHFCKEVVKMDAKNLLSPFLSEEDYVNLGKAVANGYKACDEFMKSNLVMTNTRIGMEQRSRLISVFVEHSLTNIDGFYYDFKPNVARNCWHTRIKKTILSSLPIFLVEETIIENFLEKLYTENFLTIET